MSKPPSLPKALAELPEAFVSTKAITRHVSRALKAKQLRKLASRLYTRNQTDSPEQIVRRNLWGLVAGYFPGALIADRTALENGPASDGSICLVAKETRDVTLPSLRLRPRQGHPPLDTDLQFVHGLHLSSPARAYLDNMRPSRGRSGLVPRTLSRREVEERLDTLIRLRGEEAANHLRDDARIAAKILNAGAEFDELNALISTLLGTHKDKLDAPAAIARRQRQPYDPMRLELFELLHRALRQYPPTVRLSPRRSSEGSATLAFFEAYFSNFIEGTEFSVKEAENIVMNNIIPPERPDDAHDILGTWRVVSDESEMQVTPKDFDVLVRLLRRRHANVMEGRSDKRPGEFKALDNRAGNTVFVPRELVLGTLKQGIEYYKSLETPFQRAVFMMFLVAEVHPFVDGNGRMARIMMNAELVAAGQERIVVPTVFRANYLSALKALSQARVPEPLIQSLDYAQKWTAAISWASINDTTRELEASNAFLKSDEADLEGKRLRIPSVSSAVAVPLTHR